MHNHTYRLKRFVKLVADEYDKRGKKIIDIGAGSCQYRDYFKKVKYFSQDVENNKEKSIDFVCNVKSIPVKRDSFDYIFVEARGAHPKITIHTPTKRGPHKERKLSQPNSGYRNCSVQGLHVAKPLQPPSCIKRSSVKSPLHTISFFISFSYSIRQIPCA